MKKLLFFAVMALILASSCSHPEQEQQIMTIENNELKKWYDGFDAGIHTIYVGEVLGAWKRH